MKPAVALVLGTSEQLCEYCEKQEQEVLITIESGITGEGVTHGFCKHCLIRLVQIGLTPKGWLE